MSETDGKEPFSLTAFRQELQAAVQQPRQSRIPLFIAALAALLSIVSLADNEADKVATSAHIEAANKYAYFQAKSIRMTDSKIAAEMFEKLEAPSLTQYWQKKAERYNTEKFEIIKDAIAQEKIRAKAMHKGDYYKVGVTLLQIAIVLASASVVFGGGSLFAASLLLTLISLVYSINGYGLFFEFPTNPGVFVDKIGDFIHLVRYGPAT